MRSGSVASGEDPAPSTCNCWPTELLREPALHRFGRFVVGQAGETHQHSPRPSDCKPDILCNRFTVSIRIQSQLRRARSAYMLRQRVPDHSQFPGTAPGVDVEDGNVFLK
jgi:hypothetical protein